MIKAIFWDNDGVLVDTEKLYYRANKEIFESIGIELNEEIYIENFLKKAKGAWHLAEARGIGNDEINKLRDERNNLYGNLVLSELKIIDGADETLSKLFGRYKMGIVTSSRKDHFDLTHSKTNLLKYFDFILTSDDYSNCKPSPEPYLKALEVTGLKKDECVVIEDSERGLKSALSAGLKCYIIPTELTKYSNFEGAEKVLSKVTDLLIELP